ncbi:MAG: hypothetical protein WC683_01150 [bacterium]
MSEDASRSTVGTERCTETYQVKGSPDRPVRDADRPFGPIAVQQGGDLVETMFALGRTISLGNYEFVRIQIGARVGFDPTASLMPDEALDAVRAFVGEVLDREEALVRNSPREEAPLPPLPGKRRFLWVEYGMTLNAAVRFEMHKLDLGLSRPIGDDEDAEEAVAALQEYLSQRIAAERERLRGGGTE